MAYTKKDGFHEKKWVLLKELTSTKKWLSLKGMASSQRNCHHENEWLPVKAMTYTKKNGFHKWNGFQ